MMIFIYFFLNHIPSGDEINLSSLGHECELTRFLLPLYFCVVLASPAPWVWLHAGPWWGCTCASKLGGHVPISQQHLALDGHQFVQAPLPKAERVMSVLGSPSTRLEL